MKKEYITLPIFEGVNSIWVETFISQKTKK